MSGIQQQSSSTRSLRRDNYAPVELANLLLGVRLIAPIYDADPARDRLLLASGTILTQNIIDRLKLGGVKTVLVHNSELPHVVQILHELEQSEATAVTYEKSVGVSSIQQQMPSASSKSPWKITSESFVNAISQHGVRCYDECLSADFNLRYGDAMDQLKSVFKGISQGDLRGLVFIEGMFEGLLRQITSDVDLFVSIGLTPNGDRYPYQQSMKSSMLSMAMGTTMGLSQRELIELGMGALIHDSGMLLVSPDLIESDKVLDQIEFLEITKHPTYTFDMLRKTTHIPNGARLVAYQMHERCDGSGYPRQRTATQIHPLAKIAAVADVFIALISPRPHRPGMLPYHAMEQIIRDTCKGLYDPMAVRSLLETISLFPIGSLVELSDGRIGKVLRSNHQYYTKPVVQICSAGLGSDGTEIVDLCGFSTDLDVVRPLVNLAEANSKRELAFAEDFWK